MCTTYSAISISEVTIAQTYRSARRGHVHIHINF